MNFRVVAQNISKPNASIYKFSKLFKDSQIEKFPLKYAKERIKTRQNSRSRREVARFRARETAGCGFPYEYAARVRRHVSHVPWREEKRDDPADARSLMHIRCTTLRMDRPRVHEE